MTRGARRTAGTLLAVGAMLAGFPAGALAATADLAVDKTDSADPVTAGTEFTYNVAVTNAGPDAATGVEMVDTLPSQIDVVASNPSQGSCKSKGKKVTCTIGTLAGGGAATVAIRVVPKKAGQLVNTATVSTTDTDPQPANNTDTETTTVNEPPPPPTCGGQEATIVGTEGDDSLTGTKKRDVIVALGGNDSINGFGGDDLVCAAAGNDAIRGEAGNDQVRAGSGDDALKGGDGDDVLRAGGGADGLSGGAGADTLRGGGGPDVCSGGPGKDVKRSC